MRQVVKNEWDIILSDEYEKKYFAELVNFVNSEYLFGMVNNGSHGANSQSKMSKILQEMTPRRKTSLTEKLIELNPGLPNKPGAVIVIW